MFGTLHLAARLFNRMSARCLRLLSWVLFGAVVFATTAEAQSACEQPPAWLQSVPKDRWPPGYGDGKDLCRKLGLTGTALTSFGATRAGNSDGSIPEWTGGLIKDRWPAGYKPGDFYIDPYGNDKALFTITALNYEQYADKLSEGQKEMFRRFPDTYQMHVYPSHRSFANPELLYHNNLEYAGKVEFCDDAKRCLKGYPYEIGGMGPPFPIPREGLEIGLNGNIFYDAKYYTEPNATSYITNQGGGYTPIRVYQRFQLYTHIPYSEIPKEARPANVDKLGGGTYCFNLETMYPPRSAGQILMACAYLQQVQIDAYLYLPGQRRVRKAPEVGLYDQPSSNSDGLRTTDQFRGFLVTGKEERYSYEIKGMREMFIPYNSYKIAAKGIGLDDVIGGNHLKPDLLRYELHRVWEVEIELLPGKRHLIPRRTIYADEDSWITHLQDMYDAQGNLWRTADYHTLLGYDQGRMMFWLDQHLDFKSIGKYTGNVGMHNHGPDAHMPIYEPNDQNLFTPAGLRRQGIK